MQRKNENNQMKITSPYPFLNSVPSQIYENIEQTELTKFLMITINRALINLFKWSI